MPISRTKISEAQTSYNKKRKYKKGVRSAGGKEAEATIQGTIEGEKIVVLMKEESIHHRDNANIQDEDIRSSNVLQQEAKIQGRSPVGRWEGGGGNDSRYDRRGENSCLNEGRKHSPSR